MKIKVCGMKYPENISSVAALQPDYLGFIFWAPSPRSFSGDIPPLPETVMKVGVFVDAPLGTVLEKVKEYNLQLIQLHGKETAAYCESLRKELEKIRARKDDKLTVAGIVKAMAVGPDFSFEALTAYRDVVDYFLFDSKGPLPGGNGFGFDWEQLRDYTLDIPFFLSGGIGLQEVDRLREFLKTPVAAKCHAIDVNSAFEQKPGLKDVQALQLFIEKITL